MKDVLFFLLLFGASSGYDFTIEKEIYENIGVGAFILDIRQEVGYKENNAKLKLVHGQDYLQISGTKLIAGSTIDREKICPVPSERACIIEAEVLITRRKSPQPIPIR